MDPYKTIWFAPKRTFENFFQSESKQPVYFLPFLIFGASFAIEQSYAIGNLFGDGALIWTALIMIPVGIGVIYLVFGLLLPGLTHWIGSIWKGDSTPRQMTNVYSISIIPYCILLIYQLALFATGTEPTIENMNGLTQYIIRLWTFALLIIGIARVQRFNYGLALLNLLLTYLPFLLIALMIRG
ncbi:YIP1 family protein [Marinoscillum sp. 108]|uniref:YIP1 family protein n=1 Tax=Marinoscillum sp. 108 TaxID=2653151 RepID=UPI0012F1F794|nr:conserved membrane hypothetical protein [Marinoscillum sp. 108]